MLFDSEILLLEFNSSLSWIQASTKKKLLPYITVTVKSPFFWISTWPIHLSRKLRQDHISMNNSKMNCKIFSYLVQWKTALYSYHLMNNHIHPVRTCLEKNKNLMIYMHNLALANGSKTEKSFSPTLQRVRQKILIKYL